MPKGNRKIIWPISDPHGGYRFGLMRPGIRLEALDEKEDHFTPRPTAFQQLIWRHYLSDIRFIKDLAGQDEIVLLLMGDLVQGSVLRDQPLVTYRQEDQHHIIEDALEPVLSNPNVKRVYLVKGTGVHTGKHGSAEMRMARHIRQQYGKKAWVYYHQRIDIAGVLFDIAHHGASGGIWRWVQGDQVRRYTRDIMIEALQSKEDPPKVVLRGHYHDRWIERVAMYPHDGRQLVTWSAICPGYSLFTDDYTEKQTRSKPYMTVGTVPIEVVDGRVREIYDRAHPVQVFKSHRVT